MTCCGARPDSEQSKNQFKPNYRNKPLTPKFYARHDTDVKMENVSLYERGLSNWMKREPRCLYPVPMTTNQVYGWLNDLATIYTDEIDNGVLRCNRRANEDIRLIAQCNDNKLNRR